MSYSPASIKSAAAYWVAQGGVNLGIVGDLDHQKRASYHNGKDAILKYGRTSANDYSIRTSRDKAGLTNAASALDLGRLDGSLTSLYKFSRWFADQCMQKKPGYRDVREVIFWSPTHGRVIGWSALSPTAYIKDYGDLSHKTHTHISFYRDSESRDKTPLFSAYPPFKVVPPDTSTGDDVILSAYLPGYTAVIKATSNIRSAPSVTGTLIRNITSPEVWTLTGRTKGGVDPESGSDQWYVRWHLGKWEYTAFSNASTPVAPASAIDLAAAQKQAADAKTALAACSLKVSNAKAALA